MCTSPRQTHNKPSLSPHGRSLCMLAARHAEVKTDRNHVTIGHGGSTRIVWELERATHTATDQHCNRPTMGGQLATHLASTKHGSSAPNMVHHNDMEA